MISVYLIWTGGLGSLPSGATHSAERSAAFRETLLACLVLKSARRQVLVVHPLWDLENRVGLLEQAHAVANPGVVQYIDTFNLLRRESWSYQSLG